MLPNDNADNYNIEFYPQSTRMIQQFGADKDESSFLCEALKHDAEFNHTIFLVNDGHCYAACDVRRIDDGVVTAVVEYTHAMKKSLRKGHCRELLSFLRNDLKLKVVIFNRDKRAKFFLESLGFTNYQEIVEGNCLDKWVWHITQ